MGLLSKASTLDNPKKEGLAFSDFINKHSLKICALLEKDASNYVIKNSIGFDAASIFSSLSTIDFWEGMCKTSGQIYTFSGSDISPLLQIFSYNLKDNFKELSIYKNSASQILLCEGKLSESASKDFENISNTEHKNDVLTLNPLFKNASVFLLFSIKCGQAVKDFYNNQNKKEILDADLFSVSVFNEIYNRFACRYTISDSTKKYNSGIIKTVIVTDKTFSSELIKQHIKLNLTEVLEASSYLLEIDYCGNAASCQEIDSFLQAE